MKRFRWLSVVGAAAVVVAGLALPGAATATVQHDGLRILAASATFADPADCADGTCDAAYLTAATGVLGAAGSATRIGSVVLVEVYPSAVFDEGLFPIGEPVLTGCTTQATVRVLRSLASASVDTHGAVPLGEFVMGDDGAIACDVPTGHTLDLQAAFTGVGPVTMFSSHGVHSNPWLHEVTRDVEAMRAAEADVVGTLDGGSIGQQASGSGMLVRAASRSLLVMHQVAVGPVVHGALKVGRAADVVDIASGYAGDWAVDAISVRDADGSGKAYLSVSSTAKDEACWGDTDAAVVTVQPDLSSATATGRVTVRCGEAGDTLGTFGVRATWTGFGDAWLFRGVGVTSGQDGRGAYRTKGLHRDAELTLVLGGRTYHGQEAFLETMAFWSAPGLR